MKHVIVEIDLAELATRKGAAEVVEEMLDKALRGAHPLVVSYEIIGLRGWREGEQ